MFLALTRKKTSLSVEAQIKAKQSLAIKFLLIYFRTLTKIGESLKKNLNSGYLLINR